MATQFSDAQVASYIQNNALSGAGLQSATQAFNIAPDQLARAQGLLTSGDPSVAAATSTYNQQVEGRPDLVAENLATYNPATNTGNLAATAPAPDYGQMVRDAYGSIGRTGMGDAASNIDQAGFDYWLNTLQSGASTPDAFNRNFQTAVADYLTKKPEDQYSTYVTDYLTNTKPAAVSGIVDLYRDVLGRAPDAAGLGNWFQQFGSEISPEERETFRTSARPELDKRVQGLYTDFLGRDADAEGMDYWRNQFGSTIDDKEREQFRQSAATEINKQFGVTDPAVAPTTEGILSGFKYANDSGITEAGMKKTLGEDVFNTYKTGFADYAKTGIANILADKQLSFDEARTAVKFGRDYGYDAQKLADLTGTDKKVFDAIFTNYDDTTNKIVDSVLGADDVKTDGDRISRSLALQKQYGFTDDDLAKATGLSLKQVKSYLDPVKNFESDYEKLVKDPDLNEDKTKAFLTTALQNPFIKQKLGDKLQPALDELNRPPRERMLDQIGKQRDVLGGNYYRGVFGDPEVIANVLEKKGVKSLADLGKKDKFEATPAIKRYTTKDGTPVEDVGDGSFIADGSFIPKSQVKTVYGYNEYEPSPDGESQIVKFVPLSDKDVDKDGNYQQKVGTVIVNKRTGDELTGTDHKLAVQSSSGGLKKKTNYLNVGFDKNGNAILTASSERAGLGGLVQDLAPIISMALPFVLPGLGAGLSSMLPGAGVAASGATAAIAPTLMNQALTQGIISGGLTTLGGGQFEKGFLSGAINPVINTGINSLLPAGLSDNATNAIRGAGTNVIKGLVQGESFEDLLGQGVLSGLTNYGLNAAIGSSGLTPQQLNFATGIALPLIQGQKVNPINAIGSLAQMGQPQPR